MAKKKTETLDEIVAKLDEAEKEYQQKLDEINLKDLLKQYGDDSGKEHPEA